jgi:hypothetical protein
MLDAVLHPMPAGAETASGRSVSPRCDDLDRLAIRSFLHSVMPALDCAFGLDRCETFPQEIAGLIAKLHAGPLGPARRRAALRTANARRRFRSEWLA